ncbi:MAG: WbqC family protein [Candidatus Hydrogenedentes bacterium]|nr:WbqC family protein [Candidatus Hydrogenedentota bacterium]
MLVGIHQLHYLPWLRYFEKIARSDVFIVLDNIQYNKNGYQNRNRIKGPEGGVLLTVPVLDKFAQPLDAVQINNRTAWRKKHLRSLQQYYRKAPYYAAHAPFFEAVYSREWESLNSLNREILGYFIKALGITTRVEYASELNVPGEATTRLIHLMQAVGGSTYYSGAHAVDTYLNLEAMNAAGLAVTPQQWKAPTYPQSYGEFVPDLSIVDCLLHCGPETMRVILGEHP